MISERLWRIENPDKIFAGFLSAQTMDANGQRAWQNFTMGPTTAVRCNASSMSGAVCAKCKEDGEGVDCALGATVVGVQGVEVIVT